MTRPEPSLPPYLHPALGASRPSAPEADSFRRPPAPSRGAVAGQTEQPEPPHQVPQELGAGGQEERRSHRSEV